MVSAYNNFYAELNVTTAFELWGAGLSWTDKSPGRQTA